MRSLWRVLLVGIGIPAACSAAPSGRVHGTGESASQGAASTSSSGMGGAESASSSSQGAGGLHVADGGAGGGTGCVVTDPNADMDSDGWTPNQGDCNDCDPNVNPGAIDTITVVDGGVVPGDEDCDGIKGNIPGPCDDDLAVDDPSAMDGAKAVELCTPLTDPKKWGLESARWVLPDGSAPSTMVPEMGASLADAMANFPLGYGILSAMGPYVDVQAGTRMLGLSSGSARQPTDPGYQDVNGFDKQYVCNPAAIPLTSPACTGVTTGQAHDGVGLEVVVVAPTNAHGFSFSFDFLTFEWPHYICSPYNDYFVAMLSPLPMGQTDGNISFDSQGDPVSVNNAFLTVCGCLGGPPCITHYGTNTKTFACPQGDQALLGTGFGKDATTNAQDHGSTYWLQTQAPIQPHEELTLRWAVWDSSDGSYDTTAVIDNFQWIATPGVVLGTTQMPQPK